MNDVHSVTYSRAACWGGDLREERYSVSQLEIVEFQKNTYDLGNDCYPMSERCWNSMRVIPGFCSINGNSYRDYIVTWFSIQDRHYGGTPPPERVAQNSYQMFKLRYAELQAVKANANAFVFEVGRAERNLDLARHVYGWAHGHDWAQRKGLPILEVFEQIDFFDCYRVLSGLDLYILPLQLMHSMSTAIDMKYGPNASSHSFMYSLSSEFPIEIVLKEPGQPQFVIFCKKVREHHMVVATLAAALVTSITLLDANEIQNRIHGVDEVASQQPAKVADEEPPEEASSEC